MESKPRPLQFILTPTTDRWRSGFQSQIFTILAGPQRQKFTAHASFLSQSPVLDRMCHGQFEESRTFTICLPDDRPDVIRAVIQYLYSRDIQKFGSVNPSGCTITALFDLAELYGVAEKYQLKGLKTVIIEKLETIIDVAKRPIEFLDVTKEIYDCIPDSDEDFRSFFRDAYTELLLPKDMPQVLRQQFDDHLAGGDIMAVDMVTALCTRYDERIAEMKDRTKARIALLKEENEELSDEKARYKRQYERLVKSFNTPL